MNEWLPFIMLAISHFLFGASFFFIAYGYCHKQHEMLLRKLLKELDELRKKDE